MHTFRHFDDDKYSVGQWIPNGVDSSWEGILTCKGIYDAIRAVNVLNGGKGSFSFFTGNNQTTHMVVPGD